MYQLGYKRQKCKILKKRISSPLIRYMNFMNIPLIHKQIFYKYFVCLFDWLGYNRHKCFWKIKVNKVSSFLKCIPSFLSYIWSINICSTNFVWFFVLSLIPYMSGFISIASLFTDVALIVILINSEITLSSIKYFNISILILCKHWIAYTNFYKIVLKKIIFHLKK